MLITSKLKTGIDPATTHRMVLSSCHSYQIFSNMGVGNTFCWVSIILLWPVMANKSSQLVLSYTYFRPADHMYLCPLNMLYSTGPSDVVFVGAWSQREVPTNRGGTIFSTEDITGFVYETSLRE